MHCVLMIYCCAYFSEIRLIVKSGYWQVWWVLASDALDPVKWALILASRIISIGLTKLWVNWFLIFYLFYYRITYVSILSIFIETSTLPKVIPKQGCSGMVCRLGSGVCLDKDSIFYDKVDCLNAEDEVGCPRPSLV